MCVCMCMYKYLRVCVCVCVLQSFSVKKRFTLLTQYSDLFQHSLPVVNCCASDGRGECELK